MKSFKKPTKEEELHDFLSAFIILFPVVHGLLNKKEIQECHEMINKFEEHLQKSATIILKYFLHISTEKQHERLEERWKYNAGDKREAKKWDDYVGAYQNVLDGCSKNYR